MAAKSGIQKEVLSLYRILLRQAVKKDRSTMKSMSSKAVGSSSSMNSVLFTDLLFARGENADSSSSSTAFARNEFRLQASKVNRKDFRTIEHKIRHGYKQIKLLKMPGVVNFKSW